MKTLPVILVTLILTGCAGMGTSGGTMGHSGTSSQWDSTQGRNPNLDPNLHNPAEGIYFGG